MLLKYCWDVAKKSRNGINNRLWKKQVKVTDDRNYLAVKSLIRP